MKQFEGLAHVKMTEYGVYLEIGEGSPCLAQGSSCDENRVALQQMADSLNRWAGKTAPPPPSPVEESA